jgi:hypothetical protein
MSMPWDLLVRVCLGETCSYMLLIFFCIYVHAPRKRRRMTDDRLLWDEGHGPPCCCRRRNCVFFVTDIRPHLCAITTNTVPFTMLFFFVYPTAAYET